MPYITKNLLSLDLKQLHIANTGPKIWNIIPIDIRSLPTLSSFKKNFRKLDLDILMNDNCCANCILCSS